MTSAGMCPFSNRSICSRGAHNESVVTPGRRITIPTVYAAHGRFDGGDTCYASVHRFEGLESDARAGVL